MTQPDTIKIDDVEYTRAPATVEGNRHILVLDKGWVFVGNLEDDPDGGRIILTNAKNVRSWTGAGFGGLVSNPKGAKVVLDDCASAALYVRAEVEIFRVPVPEGWAQ